MKITLFSNLDTSLGQDLNPRFQLPKLGLFSRPGLTKMSQVPTPGITLDRVIKVVKVVKQLRDNGDTEETNPELAKMVQFLKYCSKNQQQFKNQSVPSSQNGSLPLPNTINTQPHFGTAPIASTAPSQMVPEINQLNNINQNGNGEKLKDNQLAVLRQQIIAYRALSNNAPLTPQLRKLLYLSSMSDEEKKKFDPSYNKSDSVGFEVVKSFSKDLEKPKESSRLHSILYPEQILLKKQKDPALAGRLQRLLVPSITPSGLDLKSMVSENEKRKLYLFEARKLALERQLESDLKDEDRLKKLVEIKSLNLLEKQKKLRNDIINGLKQNVHISNSSERASLRRAKKQSLREAREIEKLERQQRAENERLKKQKHADQLAAIVNHGRDLVLYQRSQSQRMSKLGKAVQQFHAHIEREEQKRQERISRERLQALRADDEEAYLKLIDQSKETRITHLLQQTNQYLNSLTLAVKLQQESVADQSSSSNMATEKPLWAQTNVEMVDPDDDDKLDYYSISHKIQESVTVQPKMLIGGTLKDYQLRGLEWMVSLYNNRLNGILADEMGLGKTIQTISLVTYLIETKKQPGPFLIIVPLSTITNWVQEFEKWAPEIVVICHKGNPTQRKEMINHIKRGAFNVVLTTYDYIIRDRLILSKAKWVHMIIDEGHRMKNASSKLAITLTQHYSTRYRLILTGTPLQNNLPELWALLNFILPHIFNSAKGFDEWFNAPFAGTNGQDRVDLNEEEQLLIIRRLHKVLRPFLLRRLKKDVESDLPDKVEHIIRCKMSALQSRLYNQMRKFGTLFHDVDGINEAAMANGGNDPITGKPLNKKPFKGVNGLNNTIMQLRKICNHPFVYEEVENAINPLRTNNPLLYRAAGKFELLDRILPKLLDTGHKILIFFQMTQVMTIMEDFLSWRGIKSLRLDGSTADETRRMHMNSFNASSEVKVFLLSTRAGGQGLNLQTADTVIIFDSDWNPHQDLQAQDRAHRIGQKNEVKILRLITRKSIEETILQRAQFKLDIDGKVIQAGKFDNKSTSEEREAFLRSLLRGDDDDDDVAGANNLEEGELREDDDDWSDENLNMILARSAEEMVIFENMDKERTKTDLLELKNIGLSGPSLKTRLMIDNDLPSYYLKDYNPEEIRQKRIEAELVDKSRRHNVVYYDDGLTEEQWLEALEDDNVDMNEIIKKKRERRERKRLRQLERQNQEEQVEDSEKTPFTPQSSKKRGRPKKQSGSLIRKTTSRNSLRDDDLSSVSNDDLDDYDEYNNRDSGNFNEAPNSRKKARVVGAFDDDAGSVTVPGTPNTPTHINSASGGINPSVLSSSIKNSSSKPRKKLVNLGRTIDPLSTQERVEMVDLMKKAYELVLNDIIEEEGYSRQKCELFLDLPNKKDYPDYYIVIKRPISMRMIKKRVKASVTYNPPTAASLQSTNPNSLVHYSYSSLEEFHEDWVLMFNNARLYNEEGSMVYEDAVELQVLIEEKLTQMTGRDFKRWKGDEDATNGNEMPEEWVSAAHAINTALTARGIKIDAENEPLDVMGNGLGSSTNRG
ncbi:Chromatin structure-remodeling complex subunit snf21 [Smittium mucronatum]|uniref:Chromatin structure-remodeling complex subunit snf21 n=1 Tax=Smittium mucronatum TaxID=133383 RepID=A0A1R0H0H4_9FUNG|nr:Chromatin structure-remodeling complex subunit snf21 [Smittium mucronatum]